MNEKEQQEQEVVMEEKNIIDKIFGGTKKAWVIIMTIGLFIAYGLGVNVPNELLVLYTTIMGIYFGAGGVKLGIETQNKE